MAPIPLISHRSLDDPVAYCGTRAVRAAEFLGDVARVAAMLPTRRFMVNLCNDRYRFVLGLSAALARGQISLLPPNQTPEMLRQLQQEYEGLYALTDTPNNECAIEQVMLREIERTPVTSQALPKFEDDQVAAIVFTSGSTGHPTPHHKTWGAMARGARGEALRFGLVPNGAITLLGTVPPQHMYGLESTVLMALQNGLALHASRPFYPADVRAALENISGERVLITAPVHLRALLSADIELPPLRLIVCATAPLPLEIATLAEERFRVPLHEVYGFTEAGMVATRRTVEGPRWHCLPDVMIRRDGEVFHVSGGHVHNEVAFTDVIELHDAETFVLQGRNVDLVNVAGKRASLATLNHQLNSIEGVHDGVFFMPDETGDGVIRLAAFVVAPGLSREALLHGLRQRIDPVFLPRPLHFVDALPRNATGKLTREALLLLAQDCVEKGGLPTAVLRQRG